MIALAEYPTFRSDLEVVPQPLPGKGSRYLVKDTCSGHIMRFSEKEIFICHQLDGETPLYTICQRFAERFHLKLHLKQLEAFVRQLREKGLLLSPPVDTFVGPWETMKPFPIHANALFTKLARALAWVFTTPAYLTFASLGFLALLIICSHWNSIVYHIRHLIENIELIGRPGLLSLGTLFQILLFFTTIPLLRELAKGITCRHYGFRVPEIRYRWSMYFIPRFRLDLGEILRMPERQRFHVLSAGMLLEVSLLAISIIAWEILGESNPLKSLALSLAIATSLRFLFNANPIGYGDGTLFLSQLLKIPNFKKRAVKTARAWFLLKPAPEPLSSTQKLKFVLYGILSDTYSTIIFVAIFLLLGYLLTSYLEGLGALFFLGLLSFRFEDKIRSFFRNISFSRSDKMRTHKNRKLSKWAWIIVVVVIALALYFIPYPFEVSGEFRVQPYLKREIRTEVEALIESIPVEEGTEVKEGDLIVQLSNRLIKKDLDLARASLKREKQILQQLETGPIPEEIARSEQRVKLAETTLFYSEKALKRAEELYAKQHISEEDYYKALKQRDVDREALVLAKLDLELLKAGEREERIEAQRTEVERLEVTVTHLEGDLARTRITTSINGQITTLYLKGKIGQQVKAGDVVGIVENDKKVMLRIAVPEEYTSLLEVGARVRAKPWAYPGMIFTGKVTSIMPFVVEKTEDAIKKASVEQENSAAIRNLDMPQEEITPILVEVPNEEKLLISDMTGYAKIAAGYKSLGFALFHPIIRFFRVLVWSWIP